MNANDDGIYQRHGTDNDVAAEKTAVSRPLLKNPIFVTLKAMGLR